MSDADIGYDIGFEIEDAVGSGVFVPLIEVTNIDLPDEQTDEVEVTHMKSPGGMKEFIGGLTDPGECSVEINWIQGNATDVELTSLKASKEKRAMRIVFPGGTKWTFQGFIKGYKPTVPLGDKKQAQATIRVTGSTAIS